MVPYKARNIIQAFEKMAATSIHVEFPQADKIKHVRRQEIFFNEKKIKAAAAGKIQITGPHSPSTEDKIWRGINFCKNRIKNIVLYGQTIKTLSNQLWKGGTPILKRIASAVNKEK